MIRLLLVDDHPLYREGVVAVLRTRLPDANVEWAPDAESGLRLLRERPDFDVVLLDLRLPDARGLDALARYAREFPQVARVLISGESVDARTVQGALAAGASGFIPKTLGVGEMVAALRCVLDGGVYAPSDAVPRAETGLEGLSLRQIEVLQMMLRGNANKQIAQELGIAERTVKAHLTRVFDALGVNTRVQAAMAAQRLGLGTPSA